MKLLTRVGIPEQAHKYPGQLSGGQQQRVAIAMAFANRPKVIVCDEPTTGLDVTTQARVLETVRDLCRSYSVAALYVSHDLAVVDRAVDHGAATAVTDEDDRFVGGIDGLDDRSHVIAHYDVLLRDEDWATAHLPDIVYRIGDTPTSKALRGAESMDCLFERVVQFFLSHGQPPAADRVRADLWSVYADAPVALPPDALARAVVWVDSVGFEPAVQAAPIETEHPRGLGFVAAGAGQCLLAGQTRGEDGP